MDIKRLNSGDERLEEQRVDVIKKMMNFVSQENFMMFDSIKSIWLFKNADETDMPVRVSSGSTLYEEYLDLFNDMLAKKFLELGVYKVDFFKELSDSEDGNRLSSEEKHFMKLMLASADMSDWVRIMIRESQYYFRTGSTHFGYIDKRLTEDDTEYIDHGLQAKIVSYTRKMGENCKLYQKNESQHNVGIENGNERGDGAMSGAAD